jgi:hypothetical protein
MFTDDQLQIVLNLLLQERVCGKVCVWKTYILLQGFKVTSMCGICA